MEGSVTAGLWILKKKKKSPHPHSSEIWAWDLEERVFHSLSIRCDNQVPWLLWYSFVIFKNTSYYFRVKYTSCEQRSVVICLLSNSGNSKCNIKNISRCPSELSLITSIASKNQGKITPWEVSYPWLDGDTAVFFRASWWTQWKTSVRCIDTRTLVFKIWMHLAPEDVFPRI